VLGLTEDKVVALTVTVNHN